jgi:hypothetical protein
LIRSGASGIAALTLMSVPRPRAMKFGDDGGSQPCRRHDIEADHSLQIIRICHRQVARHGLTRIVHEQLDGRISSERLVTPRFKSGGDERTSAL